MEQLNRIELRGIVGNIRLQSVADKSVARISLVTNYAYKGKEGEPVIESTWHTISAWSGRDIPDLTKIEKGDKLYVKGRVRRDQFTGGDGIERITYEVLASKMQKIETEGQLQYEF